MDVPPEAKNLEAWNQNSSNPHPDKSLQDALNQAGGKDYVDDYYVFCLNLRHEYLLNKPAHSDRLSGASTMAEKLITKEQQITKYMGKNLRT